MIDQKIVRKNFSKSSCRYNDLALIQKNCAKKLCNLAKKFIKENNYILDLGSGSSFIAKNLILENKNQKIFEIDIALNMLQHWRERPNFTFPLAADILNLPFKNQEIFDVTFSSFALQWVENFDNLFAFLQKIIKTGGIIAFCLPTKNSLSQIRSASVKSGCNFNIINLPDENLLRQKFCDYNFKKILFSQEIITQTNKNAVDFLKNIKQIGANYSANNNFISKKQLQKFNDFFLIDSKNQNDWYINYFLFQKL